MIFLCTGQAVKKWSLWQEGLVINFMGKDVWLLIKKSLWIGILDIGADGVVLIHGKFQ